MSDRDSFGGDNDSNFDDEEDYGSEAEILDEQDEEMNDGADDTAGIRKGTKKVPDAERITSKFMTKYERARILGSRAL